MSEKKPLNLSLPKELIQDIKVVCIRQGLTVSEVVESLMWDYLQQFQRINSHSEEDENKIDR